ncbi:unnamed protein product [Rotaria sp. Silwood1]|nr:unnamed protein product [Rotaria sp. Silwood1]CAF1647311.1 unnamed protein product [Rotaria sp. Silwood1]CAF3553700.1 unnamed protein product [Rotaria sp. Silwood1]CAF3568157.1 unnamed protein product [Rotaria sp. Silwood1]CAF4826414.1 unnamed protein product [Rotaria sp. Silwood1]
MNMIQLKTPRKIPGRPSIQLSEEADDEIRVQFHLLLAEKIYPTIAILLERLLSAHKDFPVRSETTLRQHIHRLGFTYQMTSKIDEVAQEFDVQIVRHPVRHCSLNPIELAWAALKDYIRKNNTNFTMSSVYELAAEFIAGFDDKAAQDAIRHAEKLEVTYKTADNFVENIVEPQSIDDVSDTEIDNLSDDSDDSTDI